MTQPTFVPIAEADQVRPARHLHVPGSWTTSRPAELVLPSLRPKRHEGTPGTDSGFAFRLAKRFEHDLHLGEGETEHDALMGVALIGSKRAALFGRAPCIHDVRFGLNLWGFLSEASPELQARRRAAFSSLSHSYVAQRDLVDRVSEETLRLSPEDVVGGAAAA
jgi:hypothetical protein